MFFVPKPWKPEGVRFETPPPVASARRPILKPLCPDFGTATFVQTLDRI